jgi:PilZ domain-containing protein
MTTPPVQVERRVGQRFPYALAVSIFQPSSSLRGAGFTQDLSSRGAFFFTELPVTEGSEIELTLQMPSEITLGDSMPVRCRARVLRVVNPRGIGVSGTNGNKLGVAVRLEHYEYLSNAAETSPGFARISTLHSDHEEKGSQTHSSIAPLQH